MIRREELPNLSGATVVSESGDKIGSVADIYLDQETNEPEWAVVDTGLLGAASNFVPLAQARLEGNDVVVPYDKSMVKEAPSMEPDGQLSQQDEAALYDYYGLKYSELQSGSGLPEEGTPPQSGISRQDLREEGDDAMTRSEEELRVDKTEQERGRVRLRKYVVTEPVQQTVPVKREEVRVEREPVSEADVDEATTGPEISEAEHEVVLQEERPVVEKRTVPKERVKLTKDSVTEEEEVSGEIRKERIEEEGDVQS